MAQQEEADEDDAVEAQEGACVVDRGVAGEPEPQGCGDDRAKVRAWAGRQCPEWKCPWDRCLECPPCLREWEKWDRKDLDRFREDSGFNPEEKWSNSRLS